MDQPCLLLIDTSTTRPVVALVGPSAELVEVPMAPTARHASGLVPALSEAVRNAGIPLEALDGIAVGLGPGSFTGLRVGLSAAKALAYALGCRLLGLDSLQVIASGLSHDRGPILVVCDAQRGEWFVGTYGRERGEAISQRIRPLSIEPNEVVLAGLDEAALLTGPGLLKLDSSRLEALGSRVAPPDFWLPQAAAMRRTAFHAWHCGISADPASLEPVYLRRSAAEEKSGLAVEPPAAVSNP